MEGAELSVDWKTRLYVSTVCSSSISLIGCIATLSVCLTLQVLTIGIIADKVNDRRYLVQTNRREPKALVLGANFFFFAFPNRILRSPNISVNTMAHPLPLQTHLHCHHDDTVALIFHFFA